MFEQSPVIGGSQNMVELPAGRPPGTPDSADHELSACALPGVQVRAASIRGLLHRYRDQPRQDRFSLVHDEAGDTLVVTVCDGVGSRLRSQEAAAFVTRYLPGAYLASRRWAAAVEQVNERLTGYADRAAGLAAALGEDPGRHGMATTFAALAVRPGARTASIAWTGDSTVWWLADGRWTNLTPGEPTPFSALPSPEPRIKTVEAPAGRGALFVVTDGIGGPLDESGEVRDALAEWWSAAPDLFTFGSQVAFARKTQIDDRTAVGVWFD